MDSVAMFSNHSSIYCDRGMRTKFQLGLSMWMRLQLHDFLPDHYDHDVAKEQLSGSWCTLQKYLPTILYKEVAL